MFPTAWSPPHSWQMAPVSVYKTGDNCSWNCVPVKIYLLAWDLLHEDCGFLMGEFVSLARVKPSGPSPQPVFFLALGIATKTSIPSLGGLPVWTLLRDIWVSANDGSFFSMVWKTFFQRNPCSPLSILKSLHFIFCMAGSSCINLWMNLWWSHTYLET